MTSRKRFQLHQPSFGAQRRRFHGTGCETCQTP